MSAIDGGQASARDLAELLSVAVEAANAAASVIRVGAARIRTLEWRQKNPADFVSDVDTAAEEAIRQIVDRDLPGAVIVGEELSPNAVAGAGLALVVDPLDGTTNFLHGYPEYAVSIAVLVDARLVAGVVLHVPANEETTAIVGQGTRMNGMPLRVSNVDSPELALIGTGFPFKHLHLLDRYKQQFGEIMRTTSGIRRAGSAALDLVDVAAGRFDGFWELALAPWDFAAGVIIVREAGGIITDLTGDAPPLASSPIVAGSPVIHPWLLRIVAERENTR